MTRSILPVVVLVGAGLVSAAPRAAKPAASPAKKDPAADINAPRPDARVVEFEAREGTWISVDVSPDGKALAFDLLGDIYSMPIAGGEAHALTSGPAWDAQPRFSPDGTTIAFSSDRGGIENVWLMDADGGHPRPLTSEKDAYVRSPAWTPDGAYVVARKEDAKRAGIPPVELWLYHREGGGGIKLVSSDEVNNSSGPNALPPGTAWPDKSDYQAWLLNPKYQAYGQWGFRSQHPGGAHFVFGDGSVKFLKESIDLATYRALGTRAGQEVVGADAY